MIQAPRSVLQPPSINLYPKSSLSSLLINRRCYGSGLTLPDLQDRTLTVVKLFDKVNPDKVTLEAHFINDLGLDSLDTVEIVMAFEDEFGVEISDEEAEKIFTCNDAVELLKVKMDVH
jgi:NADH dehydrogenase (ubiquinone) 1 alpha/beta subcomplex 1